MVSPSHKRGITTPLGSSPKNDCASASTGTHREHKDAAWACNTEKRTARLSNYELKTGKTVGCVYLWKSDKRADRIMMFRDIIELRYGYKYSSSLRAHLPIFSFVRPVRVYPIQVSCQQKNAPCDAVSALKLEFSHTPKRLRRGPIW